MEQAPNVSPPKIEDEEGTDLFGVFTGVTLNPIGKNLLRVSRKKQQTLSRFLRAARITLTISIFGVY
ncbi:MAG: hypothetical protein ABSF34_08175 [Verrucomicrobiota bacterium]|jgi:hypothetical protein